MPPLFKGSSPFSEAFSRVTLGRMSPCFRADARLHSAQCNLTLGRMSLTGMLPRTARRLAGMAGWLVKPTSGEMTAPRGRAPRHGNLGLRHAGRAPRHAGLGGRQRKEGLCRRPYFFGDTPLFGGRGDMAFENFYYFCAERTHSHRPEQKRCGHARTAIGPPCIPLPTHYYLLGRGCTPQACFVKGIRFVLPCIHPMTGRLPFYTKTTNYLFHNV